MATDSLRLKPWFNYTDEERSLVILNAYKKRVLLSEDLKSFLTTNRIHNVSQWIFPVVAYPFLNQFLWKPSAERLIFRSAPGANAAFRITTMAVAWIAWLNFSPFYKKLENSKEDLLDLAQSRIGLNVKYLNDITPRYWTSQEINRQITELYNQRNSVLAGYLYPTEEAAEPLVDLESFPKNVRAGSITK